MKIKNENGITMIALVITIVLIIILATISIKIGSSVISETKLQTIRTNALLIQTKVKTISEKHNFDSDSNPFIGVNITSQGQEEILEKVKTIMGLQEIKDEDYYYVLSKEDLNNMKLEKVNIDDGYVVNYKTNEVIYLRGIEDSDDTLKYKLSEIAQEEEG